jgi:small-conductance mechanosensitive channel
MLGYFAMRVLLSFLRRVGKRKGRVLLTAIYKNLSSPLRTFGFLLGALLVLGSIDIGNPGLLNAVARIVEILLYGATAWVIVEAVEVIGDLLLDKYSFETQSDNFRQRKVYTQLLYIKRVVTFFAVVLAIALVLFQFDRVRELGTGLLASAGVAGIIIGVAAQKSLANLLAGFQIAFTQPLRIDDQVLVNGEFGRVEEITLTYVVIRIWDERRLIVPLNKFIEDSFQNWSRQSTQLLGTVMLYLDYRTNVEGLRSELSKLVEQHELWDKRVAGVQVTDTSEHTITVRVLVSAANPGDAFTLRCAVREGLITYLQREQPQALPHGRLMLSGSLKEGDNGQNVTTPQEVTD